MGNVDLQQFNKTFGEMLSRANNPRKPLTEIGVMMVSEQQENIRVEGRPETWEKSGRAKREGGQTLRDSGTLMRGIIFEVGDRSVSSGPTMVGKDHITDPRVMMLLAFGGEVKRLRDASGPVKKGRPRQDRKKSVGTVHYPKRDYTYIPPDATETFGQIMQSYIVEGK